MKVEQQLEELKEQAYKNAIRLFRDAAFLYTHDSYPSSFALAVTAYEEIGKVCVVDKCCDMMCLNPEGAGQLYDMYLKGPWMTDHRHKQRQAFLDAGGKMFSKVDHEWRYIVDGGLEQTRRQALYVELSGKRVETPQRVTRAKSFELLNKCYEVFSGIGDLAFSGFTAYSTSKSEWSANLALEEVRSAFEMCSEHSRRFLLTA